MAIYLIPFAIPLRLAILFLLVSYIIYLYRKYLLLSHPKAINKIVLTEMNWCYLQFNNSEVVKVDIQPDSVVTEHLVILNLKPHVKMSFWFEHCNHNSIVMTTQSIGVDHFRELKRHLRLLSFTQVPLAETGDE